MNAIRDVSVRSNAPFRAPGGIVEHSAMQKMITEGLARADEWKSFIDDHAVGYEKANGRPMPANLKAAIGQAIANTAGLLATKAGMDVTELNKRLTEDTYGSDVVSLARFTLPVITASIPTMAALDAFTVQPIDRETADVYYINFLYDQTKYGYTPGSTALSATGAPPYSTHMTDEYDSQALWTGNGATSSFSGEVRYNYLYKSFVTVTYKIGTTTYTATDNGSGVIVGTGISSGTVNYDTGAIALTFGGSPGFPTGPITVTYKYYVEKNAANGMPKIKLQLDKKSVTVGNRWLAALWSIISAYNLKTIHGQDVEQLLVNAIVGLLNHEIDTDLFDFVLDTAVSSGAGSVSFAATNPYTGINLTQYYHDLMYVLAEGDSLITAATGAPGANVIIAGLDFCNIVRSLPSQYFRLEPWKQGTYGPHRYGTLGDQYLVIRNPGYANNRFVMLFKGDDYLRSSFVYCPYMPFQQVGPSNLADDMKGRVGVVTSYARTDVNALLAVDGTITA